MQSGFLISFEGGEGAGKTEQSTVLTQRLEKAGFEVIRLREPGGTVISEQIRDVVLSAKNQAITDRTEVLLFQAARAQIYCEVVCPALEAGKVVVMDRTRDSSVVYQGIVRGIGVSLIERLNKISTFNTWPNVTFLLDIDPKLGLARCEAAGNANRLEGEGLEFHRQVRQAYLKMADKNDRSRWFIVNAEKTRDEVSADIWSVVSAKLGVGV